MADAGGIKAGRAYVELGANDSQLRAALDSAAKKLQAYGATVRSIGARVVAIGTAGLAGFGAAVNQFSTVGAELLRMSQRTGVSVEQLSAFSFALEQSGSSLQSFEGAIAAMQGKLIAASQGSKEAQDAFLMLGLSWRDLADLDAAQQVQVLAEQISRLEHPARRAQAAMQLFGSTDVLPLIEGGAAGVRALTSEAERLGLVMSTKTAKDAAELAKATNTVKQSFQAVVVTIGSAVGPEIASLTRSVVPLVKSTVEWAKENKPLVSGIFAAFVAVTGLGAGLLALGSALGVVGFAVPGLIVAAKVGLILIAVVGGLATAYMQLRLAAMAIAPVWDEVVRRTERARAAIRAALGDLADRTGLAGAWNNIRDSGVSAWNSIRETATDALGGISAAIKAGKWETAFAIAAAAIKITWLDLRAFWEDIMAEIRGLGVDAAAAIGRAWVNVTEDLRRAMRGAAVLAGGPTASLAAIREGRGPLGIGENAEDRAARQARLDEVEQTRKAGRGGIDFDRDVNKTRIGDDRKRLADEMAKLIEEAKNAGAAKISPEQRDRGNKILPGVQKADVVGSFAGAAAFGFGGKTVLDRMAAGIDDLRNTGKDILREVKNQRQAAVVRD